MKTSWMEMIERGPDRDLGAALVRLAQQAATLHWLEADGGVIGQTDRDASVARLTDTGVRQTEVNR